MRSKRSKRRTAPEVIAEIRRLYRENFGPAEIYRRIEASQYKGSVSEKTVQRIVREDLAPRDTSGPWSFVTAENPVEGRLVLEVLAYVMGETDGRVKQLTKREANWIIRLRTAFPEMPLNDLWETIELCMEYEEGPSNELDIEITAEAIDHFLAFQPWRSPEDNARWNAYWWKELEHGFDAYFQRLRNLIDKRPDIARRFGMIPHDNPAVTARFDLEQQEEGTDDEEAPPRTW